MPLLILIICIISQFVGYIAYSFGHTKVADVLIITPFFFFILCNLVYLFCIFYF